MRQTPLYVLLFKVFHAQRGQARPYMDAIGLSPGQPKLLNHLALHGDCLQKDLANAVDVEPGTISKLLNAMESSKFVMRSSIPGDKRSTMISITEEGLRLQQLYSSHMKGVEAKMMDGFTEEERVEFEELLCRVYHNLTGKEIL